MKLALLVAGILACASCAAAQTRMFLGGGPTGTSDFGFNGGWGAVLGIERRIAPAASFLLRAEGSAVPATAESFLSPVVLPVALNGTSLGESGPNSHDATLLSLGAGLRLGGTGRLAPYLDALIGVGYFNAPANTADVPPMPLVRGHASASETNVMLSFGSGLAFHPSRAPGFFAHVHYEFYFTKGAGTPVIPIRVGVIIP